MECIAVPVVSLSETRRECLQSAVWRGVPCTVLLLLLLLGSRHVVLAEICWSLAARTLDCAQLVPGVRAGAACAGRIGRGVR
jgi:ABC-type arginine transport system permease subunit